MVNYFSPNIFTGSVLYFYFYLKYLSFKNIMRRWNSSYKWTAMFKYILPIVDAAKPYLSSLQVQNVIFSIKNRSSIKIVFPQGIPKKNYRISKLNLSHPLSSQYLICSATFLLLKDKCECFPVWNKWNLLKALFTMPKIW